MLTPTINVEKLFVESSYSLPKYLGIFNGLGAISKAGQLLQQQNSQKATQTQKLALQGLSLLLLFLGVCLLMRQATPPLGSKLNSPELWAMRIEWGTS